MAEDQEEPTYVQHYRKKIAFLFSAMRHFAEEFRGWCVTYRQLSEKRI
jgi:deoxyribodipyrimidine photolyase-related protein